MPAVVSVVEVIKNAEVDLRLGITADGRIVVVIRELVQCALLMSERGAQRFLSDPANQDLAQTIGMVASRLHVGMGRSLIRSRAMSSTLRPCLIGLWKATVESM